MTESKRYSLEPTLSKSSYEEEKFTKSFFGKDVEINVISFYRWSEFEITLNDKEKEDILKKDEINLDDYEIEFISSNDCFKIDWDIVNEDQYNDKEIEIISIDVIGSDDDEESLYQLDERGWSQGDVNYGLTCGCQLQEIKN